LPIIKASPLIEATPIQTSVAHGAENGRCEALTLRVTYTRPTRLPEVA